MSRLGLLALVTGEPSLGEAKGSKGTRSHSAIGYERELDPMGTNPTTSPDEVHLAGTFATVYGFTASEDDLLAGMETTQVELRFYIDEADKTPSALLLRVDGMTIVEPSDFKGGFNIFRQIDNGMKRAKSANNARSSLRAQKGTGKVMNYTASVTDNTDEREYVFSRVSLREACARFTYARNWPQSFKVGPRVIRTAAQQANDWVLIKEYLDQRGI